VLSQAGLPSKWDGKPSKKVTGFAQPLVAHEHWHIDVSYLNIGVRLRGRTSGYFSFAP
jgi:putative transposase